MCKYMIRCDMEGVPSVVNDQQMDKNTFRNPPGSCRSAPFWSWNGKLDVSETRRQVRELADKGMGGGFIHARTGLRTEYLGEEWFQNCAAAIEAGESVGFHLWLYDEDRWPSGSCGGQTAAAHPDFRCRALVMQKGSEPIRRTEEWCVPHLPYEELKCIARFKRDENTAKENAYTPISDSSDAHADISFYSAVLPPPEGWENGGYYADVMNRDAVDEFIRNSYEPYAQRFKAQFGNIVPGVFTDEPHFRSFLPWSVGFAEEFEKRRGYSLLDKLPQLFTELPGSAHIRHDYWKTAYELFNENYIRPLADWCEKQSLALTGHLMHEGDLWHQMIESGGAMAHYVPMHIPGMDLLYERIAEISTCKQVASICHQFDKPLMLSELYGGTGYNFSFEGQKWIGDWQMALGVNFLCQHLSHYTLKGMAKRDYPPSYLHQSPWWRHYRYMADYQARLCHVLRQGRFACDILVIHPLTSAWCRFDPQDSLQTGFGLQEDNRLWQSLMKYLLETHRDFDLGDETVLAGHGRVEGNNFIVGSARYQAVIVPPVCNLEATTLDLLERFAAGGGVLLWTNEIPVLIDGKPSDRAQRLAQRAGALRASVHRLELDEVLNNALPRRLSIQRLETGDEAGDVFCQERLLENGRLYFLVNTNREASVAIKLRVPVTGNWERWDCETGQVRPFAGKTVSGNSELTCALAPAGSIVLRLNTKESPVSPEPEPEIGQEPLVLSPANGWRFERLAPNSLVLDRCRYRLNNEPFSEEMFLIEAQDTWRHRFGLPGTCKSGIHIQPWKLLKDPANLDPLADLTLQYTFQVSALPGPETSLALEDRDRVRIRINGRPVNTPASGWFMDKAFQKVAVGEYLKTGRNLIELQTTINRVDLVEDIYLVGDFGVDDKTLALIAEPERLGNGDWCTQGYPFYTDGIIYKTRFQLPEMFNGRVYIEIENFIGTVAAVWINGEKAATIGWRPYQADVTRFARPGSNDLGIEVVGSPRNLMGPRHSAERYAITPAGLMGIVSLGCSKPVA